MRSRSDRGVVPQGQVGTAADDRSLPERHGLRGSDRPAVWFWKRRKKHKAVTLYDDLLTRVSRGPLPDLLASLVVLAKEVQDPHLEKWARLEHEGYYKQNPAMSEDVVVPDYRTVPGQRLDDFDRLFVIDDHELRFINEHRLREGVAELEKHSRAPSPLRFEDPFAAKLIRENLSVEVRWFRFSPSSIEAVLTAIRGRLLDQLYSLRPAIERYRIGTAARSTTALDRIRDAPSLVDAFALHEHIRRIDLGVDTDPALAIGSAKELAETVAKHVLEHYGENPGSYKTFPQLVKAAMAKAGSRLRGDLGSGQGSRGRRPLDGRPGPGGRGGRHASKSLRHRPRTGQADRGGKPARSRRGGSVRDRRHLPPRNAPGPEGRKDVSGDQSPEIPTTAIAEATTPSDPMGEAVLRQAFELWIEPEITRRHDAGRIGEGFALVPGEQSSSHHGSQGPPR